MVVLGTRPEAIKMAPVVRVLKAQPKSFTVRVCATAQHREMLDQVLTVFGIIPDIDLDLMRPGQSLSGLAARVLKRINAVLTVEHPDWVLVQGDTTTVAMAALAAQHCQIRVGHVEAGLRTGDRCNPFPEEMNRVITDHISDLCFAPTVTARQNLLREGIPDRQIRVTGNTVIDALLGVVQQQRLTDSGDLPSDLPQDRRWLLVTAHRRESFGQPLRNICQALRRIAEERGDITHIIYPVHRNPKVWDPVHEALSGLPGVTLLPPVDYRALVFLMKRCYLVLTDSGGLQEEAPSLDKPVLVLRQTTERPEAVAVGAARVVGTDPDRIVSEAYRLLENDAEYARMARAINPYGDGLAAERIAAALLDFS
jgi:UDP-N-acetylglucosamine 2-epimerase (non-hydrolysing)